MATKATDRSEYAIVLKDETSGPARAASKALVDLRQKIERDQAALRGMQQALARMRGTTLQGSAAFKQLQAQIAAQRQRVAQAQGAYLALGGTFGTTSTQGSSLLSTLGGLVASGGGVVGIASAMAAAYVAMTTAVVGAALALGQYALAQADARRSELLHLESLTTIRRYYGLAAGTGAELQGAIDRVADSSALGRGELTRYTEQLYRMGLRGAALESALEGVSTVAATQGDAMAARYAGMYAGLVRTGGGVERLSERIRSRLGGLAQRSALGLGRQLERLRESVGRIFADVRIEGFLNALHEVVNLFSQSTETGRALHEIATDLFSPIFDQVGSGTPLVRRFFQGMVIAGLQVAIAVLRVRNAIVRTFGPGLRGDLDASTTAVNAGRLALLGLVAVVTLLAIPFAILGFALYRTWQQFQEIATVVTSVQDAIAGVSWESLGRQIPAGIVDGMRAGVGLIRQQVTAIARTAEGALRDTLGIHSPSRVFAGLGVQVSRGLAAGVDSGSGAVADSVAGLGGVATSAATQAAPTALGRSGTTVSIGDVNVTLTSGTREEARAAGEAIVDEIVRLLEGVGVEIGAS